MERSNTFDFGGCCTAHGEFLSGLCCAPCIYSFVICPHQELSNSTVCSPFFTGTSCFNALCMSCMTGGAWIPTVGILTRKYEATEDDTLHVWCSEWCCRECYCAPCAMAAYVKSKRPNKLDINF